MGGLNPYRAADDLGDVTFEVRSTRTTARLPIWLAITGDAADDLRLHVGGLAIVRRSRTERVRWEEIAELRTLTRSPALEHYRLRTYGDEVHEVRIAMPDSVATFARLHEPTLRHLLVATRSALREGSVPFGPMHADARGLRSEFAELRWERIAAVRIEPDGERLTVVGRDHTWMEFALADIPNPHVLMALHRELHEEDEAPAASEKESAIAALKRLNEASQRAPDAMTLGYTGRHKGKLEPKD